RGPGGAASGAYRHRTVAPYFAAAERIDRRDPDGVGRHGGAFGSRRSRNPDRRGHGGDGRSRFRVSAPAGGQAHMRLTINNVSWNAAGRRIIDGINVDCSAGTLTGLLGPNGSGKTSLLNVAVGLQRPANGTVHAGGDDVHKMSTRLRARRLALLEQQVST